MVGLFRGADRWIEGRGDERDGRLIFGRADGRVVERKMERNFGLTVGRESEGVDDLGRWEGRGLGRLTEGARLGILEELGLITDLSRGRVGGRTVDSRRLKPRSEDKEDEGLGRFPRVFSGDCLAGMLSTRGEVRGVSREIRGLVRAEELALARIRG